MKIIKFLIGLFVYVPLTTAIFFLFLRWRLQQPRSGILFWDIFIATFFFIVGGMLFLAIPSGFMGFIDDN